MATQKKSKFKEPGEEDLSRRAHHTIFLWLTQSHAPVMLGRHRVEEFTVRRLIGHRSTFEHLGQECRIPESAGGLTSCAVAELAKTGRAILLQIRSDVIVAMSRQACKLAGRGHAGEHWACDQITAEVISAFLLGSRSCL
jgi:hypothetical protein